MPPGMSDDEIWRLLNSLDNSACGPSNQSNENHEDSVVVLEEENELSDDDENEVNFPIFSENVF